MNRISLDDMFMQIAETVAERSTCSKLKTGSVLVRDGRIISIGYNGVASGKEHCCDYWANEFKENNVNQTISGVAKTHQTFTEWLKTKDFLDKHREWSKNNELHAECNCILYCSTNGVSSVDTTLYTLYSPCIMCAKIIYTSGVKRVVYKHLYTGNGQDSGNEGLNFLRNSNLHCERMFSTYNLTMKTLESNDKSSNKLKRSKSLSSPKLQEQLRLLRSRLYSKFNDKNEPHPDKKNIITVPESQ